MVEREGERLRCRETSRWVSSRVEEVEGVKKEDKLRRRENEKRRRERIPRCTMQDDEETKQQRQRKREKRRKGTVRKRECKGRKERRERKRHTRRDTDRQDNPPEWSTALPLSETQDVTSSFGPLNFEGLARPILPVRRFFHAKDNESPLGTEDIIVEFGGEQGAETTVTSVSQCELHPSPSNLPVPGRSLEVHCCSRTVFLILSFHCCFSSSSSSCL